MIIKEKNYDKALDMFNNLKQYIGKPVKVIYYIQDIIEYYMGILEAVNDFESIMLKDCPLLEFFAGIEMIYEISFEGEVLYRNPNGNKFYFDQKERAFGVSNGLEKLYKGNKIWALQTKDNEKYVMEIKGVNLVEEDKKTEWLSFVEYFYERYQDSLLMNLVIDLLGSLNKRISYEVIYDSLVTDKTEFYEKEMAIALDIVSYFTSGGRFLREYLQNRFKGLNLTLQK